jgi:hypothetical protein
MDRNTIDYDLAHKLIDLKMNFCKLQASNFLFKKMWEDFKKYSNFTECPIKKV